MIDELVEWKKVQNRAGQLCTAYLWTHRGQTTFSINNLYACLVSDFPAVLEIPGGLVDERVLGWYPQNKYQAWVDWFDEHWDELRAIIPGGKCRRCAGENHCLLRPTLR